MFVGHELHGGRIFTDLEVAARVVEAEGARAIVARGSPDSLGRRGPRAEPIARPEALAEHRAAHLFEGVAKGVAVDPEAETHILRRERRQVGQPVAEIALGRRTEANIRA